MGINFEITYWVAGSEFTTIVEAAGKETARNYFSAHRPEAQIISVVPTGRAEHKDNYDGDLYNA